MASRRAVAVKRSRQRPHGHVQEPAPRAEVKEPRERHKASSAPCVLKPGTLAWAQLWPRLTQPDPEDRELPEGVFLRRPRTRAECASLPRPCPYVSCPHHRYLSVNPVNGSIWINCPDVLPWEMEDSCLLDVIDAGGEMTLAAVGKLHNLTKERIRQVERDGLARLREVYTDGD